MAEETVVEVLDLVKQYGELNAVNGVSFNVTRGEVFGLLGQNGAGKTTTLEIIEGLRKPSSGRTRVFGLDSATEIDSIKQRIGVQLQASAYFDQLELGEILALFGTFYEKARDANELLEMVNLLDKSKMRVSQLSGGQAQRFSLVASLVNDPELVFFDEPTTGLDPLARRNIWELIRAIQEEGKTVILTSHYLEEVESLCNRVGIMKKGELVALDTVANLVMTLENPIRVDFLPASGLGEASREALSGMGKLASSDSRAGEYTLYLKDQAALNRCLRELEKEELGRVTVTGSSLEDVFVKLTGSTITDEA